MAKTELETLLTIVEVAELLQVNERTVRRLVDRGDMPSPVKIGDTSRWSPSELQKWIEAGCPKGSSRSRRRTA